MTTRVDERARERDVAVGFAERIELRVRAVVADVLGVSSDVLDSSVSLVDDLAADSLDLAELAVALETAFGLPFEESAFDEVRTYEELVALVMRAGRGVPLPAELAIRAAIMAPGGDPQHPVRHTGPFTPYAAQALADEALHAGRGTRLEVRVRPPSPTAVDVVGARLAWLCGRGIDVVVRPDQTTGARALRL
ncbi:MAG: acyl carrier protein [bacterium]|nr:acyl carrier protein [bacterium]